MDEIRIKRALISVSDKTGILSLAKVLAENSVEILSTGGTSKLLKDEGVTVTSVDAYTGSPEIMDGRVKTLHPMIHGGILAVRDNSFHKEEMTKYGIKPIDLVVVNLYPFKETIAKDGVSLEEAIENIDIGGPTMIRSSAKNNRFVTVVVDPSDYQLIISEITDMGSISYQLRTQLALKAFNHTADYDSAICAYLKSKYRKKG